jgi:hypothetical protein
MSVGEMKPMHGTAEKAIGKTIARLEYSQPDKDSFNMRIHFTDGSGFGVGFNANTTMTDESGKKTPIAAGGWAFTEAPQGKE